MNNRSNEIVPGSGREALEKPERVVREIEQPQSRETPTHAPIRIETPNTLWVYINPQHHVKSKALINRPIPPTLIDPHLLSIDPYLLFLDWYLLLIDLCLLLIDPYLLPGSGREA